MHAQPQPAVVIHAGAGNWTSAMRADPAAHERALQAALARARAVLQSGGAALDAAQAAVACMEDEADEFNAGRGAVLCPDGTVELSAGLMRGSDRAAGAVAGVTRSRFPSAAARAVLESHQVLVIGARADELAAAAGVEQRPPDYFVTDGERECLRQLLEALASDAPCPARVSGRPGAGPSAPSAWMPAGCWPHAPRRAACAASRRGASATRR